jgi:putative PIN family toxin of toxin-antitoxin system
MPPRIVIDTNVLLSALRSRRGASFQLLSRIDAGLFDACLSVPLFCEYEDVLLRDPPLPVEALADVLTYLLKHASLREIFFLWRPLLPDPRDELVLEVAVASTAQYIVTFNKRHFRPARQFGIQVVTPLELLKSLGALP